MTYPASTKPPTIRDLMPDGYLAVLAERTGMKTVSNISQLVLRQQTSSTHWPQVEKLAQETNPEGFARWQAAQQPAVAG